MSTDNVLEVFYDYTCAWCYFSTARTDRLAKEVAVQFKWTVFPLHSKVPEQGMEMTDLYAGFDITAMKQRLSAVAAAEGLPFKPHSRMYNTRKAQELGKLADKLGLIIPYQKSVYHAYFVEGRNIALPDELTEIGRRAGLPDQEMRSAILEGRYSKEVDEDWARCKLLGIDSVPAYVCRDKVMVGFKHYQDLVSLVQAD